MENGFQTMFGKRQYTMEDFSSAPLSAIFSISRWKPAFDPSPGARESLDQGKMGLSMKGAKHALEVFENLCQDVYMGLKLYG